MALLQQLQRIGTEQGIVLRERYKAVNKERQTLFLRQHREGNISDIEKRRLRYVEHEVDVLSRRLHPVDWAPILAKVAERKKLAKRVERLLAKVYRLLAQADDRSAAVERVPEELAE